MLYSMIRFKEITGRDCMNRTASLRNAAESSIFRRLTVRQNLQIIMEHTGFPKKEQKARADQLLEDPFAETEIFLNLRRRSRLFAAFA